MKSLELLKKHLNDMQHALDSDNGWITQDEIKALLDAVWDAIEDVEQEAKDAA